jgi:hypothetical protein
MLQVGQKVIVTYRGSEELTGVLSVINDKVIVIEVENGTITLDRADVELQPVKRGRKPKAKKETETVPSQEVAE